MQTPTSRLQGPRGTMRHGYRKVHVVAYSMFERKPSGKPGWRWIARDEHGGVIVVYEVEDWSDSGEDGALWQLRELASAALHDARAHHGF